MTYPLDIDGTPIHAGDLVTLFGGSIPYPVERVTEDSIFIRRLSDNSLSELNAMCARPEVVTAQPAHDMPTPNALTHDYYKREGAPEAVDVISGVAGKLGRLGMSGDDIWLAGTALKYALRAGIKTKDPEADYRKAADYLYRLSCGVWPWEVGCSD